MRACPPLIWGIGRVFLDQKGRKKQNDLPLWEVEGRTRRRGQRALGNYENGRGELALNGHGADDAIDRVHQARRLPD